MVVAHGNRCDARLHFLQDQRTASTKFEGSKPNQIRDPGYFIENSQFANLHFPKIQRMASAKFEGSKAKP